MSARLPYFLPILDDHVPGMTCQHSKAHFQLWAHLLVAYQHLHVFFDHEVVVIRRQCLGRWVVPEHYIVSLLECSGSSTSISTQHELCKILVVFEHKSADRIEVGHVRLPAQHVAHDCSIALEAICLQCGKTA
jgi:hypothetical protein